MSLTSIQALSAAKRKPALSPAPECVRDVFVREARAPEKATLARATVDETNSAIMFCGQLHILIRSHAGCIMDQKRKKRNIFGKQNLLSKIAFSGHKNETAK